MPSAPVNLFRGDAAVRRQVWTVDVPPGRAALRYRFTINDKSFTAEGWAAATVAAAWNDLGKTVPEFREVTASAVGVGYGNQGGTLVLTGPADGAPFDCAVTPAPFVAVVTETQGRAAVDEVQRVLLPASTDGTWSLTYDFGGGAETTAAIDWDASASDVQDALEGLASVSAGDVAVTLESAGSYLLAWGGDYAAAEVPEPTVDTSALVGSADASVSVTTLQQGRAAGGEVQRLTAETAYPQSGYAFRLAMDGLVGPTTLNPGATANEVEIAVQNLNGADPRFVNAYVTGAAGGPWTVHFLPSAGDLSPLRMVVYNDTGQTLGTTEEVSKGGAAANERQRVAVTATGGTYTLSFKGQTTGALAWDADAAAVQAALRALSTVGAAGVDVTGAAGALTVEFAGALAAADQPQLVADGGGLTTPGYAYEVTPHDAGEDELQTVAVSQGVDGGTFTLSFGPAGPTAAIAWDASAAAVQAALEALTAIGAGGVAAEDVSAGVWRVRFAAAGARTDVTQLSGDAAGLTVSERALLAVGADPGGPTHWDDPSNWTLLRVPESGDLVWLDQDRLDVLYGLRQRTGFALFDAEAGTLAADGPLHLRSGQRVTLRSTDTLPGGLDAGDWYVRDADRSRRTFRLAATRGGAAAELSSDAGTGAHLAIVELEELHVAGRHTGRLGLTRRAKANYWEYRPRSLAVGLRPDGPRLVRVGEGEGAGSRLVRLDLGTEAAALEVIATASAEERGVPACTLTVDNAAATFEQWEGDSGLSVFPDESGTLGAFRVGGGGVATGEGQTILGPRRAKVGSVRGAFRDAAGVLIRWE